ncbi:flagellar hook-associated protein FlgK [Desulfosporosinus fructosivorans]|uniref:Flagellar hook-associated protein 1 n=1 Tax=Desulfosporosinus fructosivorans TaxID=2018669 RepID=A0A4Z0RCA7_9FIRM|nr:flagellar hook-associated protein FlgK [Desulfosporosinus fructosivorans]TGE39965.1 flagellar hook-associated protein FlgK [Desulfosporosinus fructosivorans]
MSSTFGGLNILSRSLSAQQASLDTVGHNIANAGTDGYSRQRVNLVVATPAGEVYGRTANHSGSGVTVASITRARDTFTDRQLWKESATLGYSETSSEALSRIEGVFSEPSDTGVQTVLNQFWTAWSTLATNASDSGARTAVAQRGVAVVNAIQHAGQQLKDTVENINSSIALDVKNINQITSSIDTLNKQIAFTEVGGKDHANDLRDSRDLLVDQLSKLVNISVQEDSDGKYTILSGEDNTLTLVDPDGYTELDVTTTGTAFGYEVTQVIVAGDSSEVNFTNGEVSALIDSRDSDKSGIAAYMTNLEAISHFLLEDFNAVHNAGYGTNDDTGVDFFVMDGGVDYSDGGWIDALVVNSDITDSTAGLALIAAKTEAGSDNNASGDNAILLGNCLKTDKSTILGDISLDSFYSAMIGTLGVQSQDAIRLNTNQQTVIDQLSNLRASVSGVSLDEEMTDMIRFQKGYNASARVLTAMDEMLDKLINSTGTVGR